MKTRKSTRRSQRKGRKRCGYRKGRSTYRKGRSTYRKGRSTYRKGRKTQRGAGIIDFIKGVFGPVNEEKKNIQNSSTVIQRMNQQPPSEIHDIPEFEHQEPIPISEIQEPMTEEQEREPQAGGRRKRRRTIKRNH